MNSKTKARDASTNVPKRCVYACSSTSRTRQAGIVNGLFFIDENANLIHWTTWKKTQNNNNDTHVFLVVAKRRPIDLHVSDILWRWTYMKILDRTASNSNYYSLESMI